MTNVIAIESRKATIDLDAFECSVCYSIPSPTTMILCSNGHVVCSKCRPRLQNCGVCKSHFIERPFSNVLTKVLDSVQLDCQFVNDGCKQKVSLSDRPKHETRCRFRNICKYSEDGCDQMVKYEDRRVHEEKCFFRPIYCFSRVCQSDDKVPLPITGIIQHFRDSHNTMQKITIDNLEKFEFSNVNLLGRAFSLIYQGKMSYILVANFGLDVIYNGLKVCLISTRVPEETAQLNCTITLKVQGNNILNHTGKVFSIDDTLDIHSIQSGGLIYPENLRDKLEDKVASFSVSVFQI